MRDSNANVLAVWHRAVNIETVLIRLGFTSIPSWPRVLRRDAALTFFQSRSTLLILLRSSLFIRLLILIDEADRSSLKVLSHFRFIKVTQNVPCARIMKLGMIETTSCSSSSGPCESLPVVSMNWLRCKSKETAQLQGPATVAAAIVAFQLMAEIAMRQVIIISDAKLVAVTEIDSDDSESEITLEEDTNARRQVSFL